MPYHSLGHSTLESDSPMPSSVSLCNSNSAIPCFKNFKPWQPTSIPLSGSLISLHSSLIAFNMKTKSLRAGGTRRRLTVFAITEGSAKKSEDKGEEAIPKWARPDSEEPPPWAKNEAQQQQQQISSTFDVPFYVYLLASAITAIAAIGSVFEYMNKNPVFGVVNSDSIFYAPLLGFFAITGIPTSAFLWFKSVETANREAEEQDRRDGYR